MFTASVYCQRYLKMSVNTGGKTERISYITKNEISYVPVGEFAKLFNAPVYLNKEASKAEVKFDDYKIKITGRNQFVILTGSDSKQSVYQIPVSTLLINDEIFIPVIYTSRLFGLVSKKDIIFDEKAKNIDIKTASARSGRNITPEQPRRDITEAPINSKYDIYGIDVEEKSNGTLIRLKSSRRITIPRNSINEKKLFVFFNSITFQPNLAKQVKPAGLVKSALTRAISAKNIQLEFDLKEGFSSYEVSYAPDNNDILIAIHNQLFTAPAKTNVEELKNKWALDAIVIDPGHGGKDPGAVGVNGVYEKDVNLGVALKLGNMIKQEMPGINVVYTRQDDSFVELYKRGKIANENGGKLFISIHCNSMPHKPSDARGFEVYLLRLGKTKEAVDIAEFENSVIKLEDNPDRYKKLTDENFIFVSMAHSSFMRFSESFSDYLNQMWGKRVETPSRGVKQAGFYVLVGASMPSVLIETGFLSNTAEERFLSSSGGQNDIARAIFESIKKYKEFYESSVLEKTN